MSVRPIAVIQCVLTIALCSTVCRAQDRHLLQYAAKAVCGKSAGRAAAPGMYFTAINIHNPSDAAVGLRWKVASAPETGEPGHVSEFAVGELLPDQAMEIDCPAIQRRSGDRNVFTGFVVIEAKSDLDVVAVYTAAGSAGGVSTIEVERVPIRQLGGCVGPDLIVESIEKPVWDAQNHRSVIRAVIRNIGNANAAASPARVIDPSTTQPDGVPQNATADVPALATGASFTAAFFLPYWVYNPDATLEVTADYKNMVKECNEGNNLRVFNEKG